MTVKRTSAPIALPPIAHLLVPAHQAQLIRALAEPSYLDDARLHERAAQLAWRRLVAERLGDEWAELVHLLRRSLDRPPHAALVRSEDGVPSEALLTALAVSLGIMADPYRKQWSRILQWIRPREDGSITDARWHTDSPGWPRPNDITCLLCVKPAATGGATEILPWPAMFRALSTRADLLPRMVTYHMPWVLDPALGGGQVYEPIITETGVRYMREAFGRVASAHPGQAATVEELYGSARELLDPVTDFHSIQLDAGEVLVFDNRRCLHRRGPLDPESGQDRLLVRVRLEQPAWARAAKPVLAGMRHLSQSERHPLTSASPAGAVAR